MREIKFRIYNKQLKKYITLEEYQNLHAIEVETDGTLVLSSRYRFLGSMMICTEAFDIQQYTGLHDENRKKIYEGDILEFSYDTFTGDFDTKVGKGIVEFVYGAFYIKPFEIEGKKIEDIENEEWFLLYTVNEDTLEVIGNIYDNKELLEKV